MAAKYIMGYISRVSGGGPRVQVRGDAFCPSQQFVNEEYIFEMLKCTCER